MNIDFTTGEVIENEAPPINAARSRNRQEVAALEAVQAGAKPLHDFKLLPVITGGGLTPISELHADDVAHWLERKRRN